MNETDLDRELDLLAHAPEGTCLELQPGSWLVRGRTKSYGVHQYKRTCGCPQFQYRLKGDENCRHLTILDRFIARGEFTCPLCRGEGCSGCEEIGRVNKEENEALLLIKEAQTQAREEALKLMFR